MATTRAGNGTAAWGTMAGEAAKTSVSSNGLPTGVGARVGVMSMVALTAGVPEVTSGEAKGSGCAWGG